MNPAVCATCGCDLLDRGMENGRLRWQGGILTEDEVVVCGKCYAKKKVEETVQRWHKPLPGCEE